MSTLDSEATPPLAALLFKRQGLALQEEDNGQKPRLDLIPSLMLHLSRLFVIN